MLDYVKLKDKWVFLSVLFILIVIVILAAYSQNAIVLEVTKLLIVLSFIIVYRRAGLSFGILFKLILALIVLNMIIKLMPKVENTFSLSVNVSSYCLLIYYPLRALKKLKLKDITDFSFLLVVIINCIIAFLFYQVVAVRIESFVYFILVAIHIVVILLLSFSAFAVFIQSGRRQSLLFVFMVLAFLPSDIMFAINAFYQENILLVIGDELLNVLAWYFLFSFMYEKQFEIVDQEFY